MRLNKNQMAFKKNSVYRWQWRNLIQTDGRDIIPRRITECGKKVITLVDQKFTALKKANFCNLETTSSQSQCQACSEPYHFILICREVPLREENEGVQKWRSTFLDFRDSKQATSEFVSYTSCWIWNPSFRTII